MTTPKRHPPAAPPTTRLSACLQSLVSAQEVLCHQMTEHPPSYLWMAGGLAIDALDAAFFALTDIWRTGDGIDPRSTPTHPGLVIADEPVLSAARSLNEAKKALAEAVAELRPARRTAFASEAQHMIGHHDIRNRLARLGAGRLSLKSACRQVVVCDAPIDRVGFTWSSQSKSVKSMTAGDALKTLLNDRSADPRHIEALMALPADEKLAQVQKLAPMLRANIVYANGQRETRRAQLPFFAPKGSRPPEHNFPSLTGPEKSNRLRRSDRCLQDSPYIEGLRLYRYKQ